MPRAGLTWMQIAERIPGRIGKQCRERWTNHLDPNLKKGGWTHEEDTILAEAQQRWGNAWTKIAKLLPGRAENAVKNRWNSAFRRKKSAMFGKGPPQDEDTATIARARTQMEAIDRDEREPSDKQRSSKRAVASSSSIPAPSRTTRSSSAPQAKTRTRVKTAADASAALDRSNSMPAGQDSPSTMLDLFGARRGVLYCFDLRPRASTAWGPTPSTRAETCGAPGRRRRASERYTRTVLTTRPTADEGRRRLGF
jgi:hypothetical protein